MYDANDDEYEYEKMSQVWTGNPKASQDLEDGRATRQNGQKARA